MNDRTLDHLRAVVDQPDLSGTRYQLLGLIGRGGMGAVYRVADTVLDREVALKVIDVPGAGIEARVLARLEHPGIVAVHDAGVLADGRAFFVMRLVSGRRLDQFLADGPGLSESLGVFEKLCDAVGLAHSRGVVHRDLKPENVVVGEFGEVVVLDWGVAMIAQDGAVAGTSRYMAPEQRSGGEVDHRADVYALGIVLREMAAERPLLAIAEKASAERAEERYADVRELVADVRRYQDREPVSAYRESLLERLDRFARRNAVLLWLIAAYVAARVLVFFLRPS